MPTDMTGGPLTEAATPNTNSLAEVQTQPDDTATSRLDLRQPSDQHIKFLAWLETRHPNYPGLRPTVRARIEVLALDADNVHREKVLTRKSVPELAARHGWTRGQTLRTLAAVREAGIAYTEAQYEVVEGRPRQVGSLYRIVTDGLFAPQQKRALSAAQKRGAKRAIRTRRDRLPLSKEATNKGGFT